MPVDQSGWLVARAFEKPLDAAHFAHTSPIYVQIGNDRGLVPEDARYFIKWIDREIKLYEKLPDFATETDRQAMLAMFREARQVYARLAEK